MKRVVSLVTVVLMILSLAVAAYATDVEFVPSITAKPAPEMDNADQNADGKPVINVKNEGNEVVYSSAVENLVITSIAQVMNNENVLISEESVEILKAAYEQLNAENVKLADVVPELVEKLAAEGLTEEHVNAMVAVALFDVTVFDDDLKAYLAEEGHTVELTFQANVPADNMVYAVVFNDNKWQLVETVNNGDGTITVLFGCFGPVAILTAPMVTVENAEIETEAAQSAESETQAVESEAAAVVDPETEASEETPAAEGDPEDKPEGGSSLWLIILIAAAAVGTGVAVAKRKGAKESV